MITRTGSYQYSPTHVTDFGAQHGTFFIALINRPTHSVHNSLLCIMDEDHTHDEYEELTLQIEDLKRQNQILRLEDELGGFRRELGEMSGIMSTPALGIEEQAV